MDYNALVWVLQQLFQDIQTMKPNSSRSQSSEIFLICLSYNAPQSIDSKLFDPNFVFKEVQDPGLKKPDIFHKKYDSSHKRQRGGYDESLGITLRSKTTVSDFMHSKEPIRLLTDVSEILFSENCEKYKSHPKTTEEVKIALSDLKVLGKIDFKKLLKWRQVMIDEIDALEKVDNEVSDVSDEESGQEHEEEIDEEEKIMQELNEMKAMAEQQRHREIKKERKLKQKERLRQSLGLNQNAFSLDHDSELFSLDNHVTRDQIDQLADVNLDEDDNIFAKAILDEEAEQVRERELASQKKVIVVKDDTMEDELEEDYLKHTSKKRLKAQLKEKVTGERILGDESKDRAVTTKKMLKNEDAFNQLKAIQSNDDNLLNDESEVEESGEEDDDSVIVDNASEKKRNVRAKEQDKKLTTLQDELQQYMEMLSGKNKANTEASSRSRRGKEEVSASSSSSDDDDDSEGTDGESDKPMVTKDKVSLNSRTSKWFANPIFQEKTVSFEDDESSDSGDSDIASDEDDKKFSFMPKTDKQKRHEKRLKEIERRDRKVAKRQRHLLEDDEVEESTKGSKNGFSIVGADLNIPSDILQSVQKTTDLIARKRAKTEKDHSDSRLTSGEASTDDGKSSKRAKKGSISSDQSDFEIVSEKESQRLVEEVFPKRDDREYDSENEEYDSHDRIMTLALGTYMLRQSRKKALIDASYNRYSWNDPQDLPSWFLDDEVRHNRPQLPVPHALVDQVSFGQFLCLFRFTLFPDFISALRPCH